MSTDADTWLRLRRGEFSGIDAFQQRRLAVRGNLDFAIAFEGMFRLVGGRRPLVEIHDIPVGRHHVSTLTMGRGPDVLLLHGLGGTRASLFETAAALSQSYRVHAPDLPGFGSSSKPSLGGYNARWFAEIMFGLMDQLGIARAPHRRQLDGRPGRDRDGPDRARADRRARTAVSSGGVDPARAAPDRPAAAARARILPHTFRRSVVVSQFWSMFHDRDLIDPAVADLVVDEFRRIYHTAGARYALLSARATSISRRRSDATASTAAWPNSSRRRCSCGAATIAWCRRRSRVSAQVAARGRAGHDRRIAATSRRWSARRRRTSCCCASSAPGGEQPGGRPRGLSRGRRGRLTPEPWPRQTQRAPRAATDTRHARSKTPRPRSRAHRRSQARAWRELAGVVQRRIPRADLDERDPDYIREQLPRFWLLSSIWFRGEVRGLGQHPRRRSRAARGQPLGREHDPGHDGVHGRVQHLLRGRARLLSARAQPGAVAARPELAAEVRHGRRVA